MSANDIAIIGMSCVFPKAPDIRAYWQNIVSKSSAISDPPPDRQLDEVYDPQSTANDRIYCRRGGYIDDLTDFNPLQYGIMPVAIDGAEPEVFMALKVAAEALEDAGFGKLPFNRDNFEIIVGRGSFVNRGVMTVMQHGLVIDQTLRMLQKLHPDIDAGTLLQLKASLKEDLPPFNSETAPGLASSVMTGIIANRMDLTGRNYAVDAACASGLIALENAVQDLCDGHCDAALVGAIQISTRAPIHMLFTQLGALSRHETLRPFDSETDGTMLGEGIGMMVLKRLEDAVRDGHRIYAVVKGVGSSSDGKAKGLLAPRREGQEVAMARAYARAELQPETIGLIEAHGTGLRLGDVTEISSLGGIFGNDGQRQNKIALGTVKSMIGHLIPAAGMAGLIKTSLALYHKTLPAMLGVQIPNPELGIEKTPLYLNTETRPWIHGSSEHPRRAGVNAFGFGGINAHAILEEYAPTDAPARSLDYLREAELCVLSATSRPELIQKSSDILDYLRKNPEKRLVDIAFSLWQLHRQTFDAGMSDTCARLGIVASSSADLINKLETAIEQLNDAGRQQIRNRKGVFYTESPLGVQGSLAFMFPGEGSQYVDMLKDLSLAFPVVRRSFDLLDRAFAGHGRGFLPSEFIYPPPLADKAQAEGRMFNMDGAVDAVIAADRALYWLLDSLGIKADAIVGHSSGELMALEAAGAFEASTEDELVHYIREGNRAIEALRDSDQIPEAQLLAVGNVTRDDIDEILHASAGRLILAMENCPLQFVLCGKQSDIEEFLPALAQRGALCQSLPFSRAYHTSLFEPALGSMRAYFDTLPVRPAVVPLYSCLNAKRFPASPDAIREISVMQWARPVLFKDTVEKMYEDGVRIFLEVGPRSNLTGFAGDILKDKDALVLSTNSHRKSGLLHLLQTLCQLFAHAVDMQLDPLFDSRQPRLLNFAAPAGDTDSKPANTYKLSLVLPQLELKPEMVAKLREKLRPAAPAQPVHSPQPPQISAAPAVHLQADDYPLVPPLAQTPKAGYVDPDSAVFNAYQDTMDAFLELQQQAMTQMLSGCTNVQPMAGQPEQTGPALAGVLIEHQPHVRLVQRHVIDLARYPYLRDHTMGGSISRFDTTLCALPVIPLSMAVEVMAGAALEFARLENPVAYPLVRIRDISLTDWILIDKQGGLQLESTAVPAPDGAVSVRLSVVSEEGVKSVSSCVCYFAPHPVQAASQLTPDLGNLSDIRLRREDFYPRHLFHGPAFRCIQNLVRAGAAGSEAELRLPPAHMYQRDDSRQSPGPFSAQPILTDGIGQAVGLWLANQFDENIVAFPSAIDEIVFTGEPVNCGERVFASVRTLADDGSRLDEGRLYTVSNADVVDESGRLRFQVRGLRHRRVVIPSIFHDFRGSRQVRLTSTYDQQMSSSPEGTPVHCRVGDRIHPDFWLREGGLWEKMLAYIILDRQERELWCRWASATERREWLLSLLAIKETVVEFLQKHQGLTVNCADVHVALEADGSATVSGDWQTACGALMVVSSKVGAAGGELLDLAFAAWSTPVGEPRPGARAETAVTPSPYQLSANR